MKGGKIMKTKKSNIRKLSTSKIDFNSKEVKAIKNTVAKKANEDEFKMFMHIAKTYGLDPFNKEIFFWKIDKNPTIMTSRDGYLKIANRDKNFDGILSDVVRSNDKFVKRINNVEHEYATKRGKIIGAYAFVYRKDRKYPTYCFAPFEEYNASTRVWNSYPSAMILKVAESMALKRAFSVSGLVSKEEMDMIKKDSDNIDQNEPIKIINDLSKREKVIKRIVNGNEKLKNKLFSYLKLVKENSENNVANFSIDDLSDEEYKKLKSILFSSKKNNKKSS